MSMGVEEGMVHEILALLKVRKALQCGRFRSKGITVLTGSQIVVTREASCLDQEASLPEYF